jgi:hypothetical protein
VNSLVLSWPGTVGFVLSRVHTSAIHVVREELAASLHRFVDPLMMASGGDAVYFPIPAARW